MNLAPGESATLAAVGYDEARELLQLEFRSQAICQYQGVPTTVHEALLHAPSKGSYFNRAIRGKFPYTRISHGQTELPEHKLLAGRQG